MSLIFLGKDAVLNKLKWKTLARCRAKRRATFIHKCLNNLSSHRFNIDSIRINTIIILDVKIISVRVHLVGTGGIGPRQILPQNDWNKLDLSIRQSPFVIIS